MSATTSTRDDAAARSSKPYVVVSADTHIGPRLVEDLREYCPASHLRQFDEQADQIKAMRERMSSFMSGTPMSFRNMETAGHYDVHALHPGPRLRRRRGRGDLPRQPER